MTDNTSGVLHTAPDRPKFAALTITPTDAQELLESTTTRNRKIRPQVVRRYAQAMKDGAWRTDADLIHFDSDLNVINGFHRLNAVIVAGVPVAFNVLYDVDPATMTVIDTGARRSGADTLDIAHGVRLPGPTQALINLLSTLERRPNEVWRKPDALTNDLLNEAFVRYNHGRNLLGAAVSEGRALSRNLNCLDSAAAALWYLLKTSDAAPEDVSRFFHYLRLPDRHDPNLPPSIRALRRELSSGCLERKARNHISILIATWNAYAAGESNVHFEDIDPVPHLLHHSE